jgi:hypothetical protein
MYCNSEMPERKHVLQTMDLLILLSDDFAVLQTMDLLILLSDDFAPFALCAVV